jgi:hypothetical protein
MRIFRKKRSERIQKVERKARRWDLFQLQPRIEILEARVVLTSFIAGDLVVVRTGTGTALTSAAAPVFLDQYNPTTGAFDGTVVTMPTAENGSQKILTLGGSAASEGQMNLSPDGKYLALVGYDATVGTASPSAQTAAVINRVVGVIGASGTVDTSTALTDFANANNARSAITSNGTNIYVVGADSSTGGIKFTTLGSTTSTDLSGTALKNARGVQIDNGQLYLSTAKTVTGTANVDTVGAGLPTTGTQTLAALSGVSTLTTNDPDSFYLTNVSGGSAPDTLYIADDLQGIVKYSLVAGTWTQEGIIGTAASAYADITGSTTGSTVTLYATRKSATAGEFDIVSVVDSSGLGAAVSSSTPINVVATSAANESFRGIAFAPTSGVVAGATHFAVTAPPTSVAGSTFSITVTAQTSSNTTYAGYVGTVHFTSTDTGSGIALPANYTFLASDNGVHTFTGVTLVTAGSKSITAIDTVTSSITGSASITVTASTVSKLAVSTPATETAGTSFGATVTAEDQFNNTVTSYVGTVQFSKTDNGTGSAAPANYTFLATDNGVHVFTGWILVTAASQTITATDTVTSSIKGTAAVTVTPGAIAKFAVSAPASAVAGVAFSATITAEDQFNNTITGYAGTVHFTKTDNGAGSGVPPDYTFVPATDNGIHTFTGVILVTAASQTLTATDTVTTTAIGTATISVSAATLSQFAVTAPATSTAGSSFSVTVTAEDQFSNTITGYAGTVQFSKTDNGTGSAIPANYTFIAGSDKGVHTFTGLILVTAASQAISVKDTVTTTDTGSANVSVSAAALSKFAVTAPTTTVAGASFSLTVTAEDQFSNTITGYAGTVHFTKTDGGTGSAAPADYTFVPATDVGTHTFTGVVLVTAASQTITVKDTVATTVTGNAALTVTPAAASTFNLSLATSETAGVALTLVVTAKDQFSNTVTGYAGTVHFTKTDSGAGSAVPLNYTFVPATDNGAHTFTSGVTLVSAGSQSITVTDTVATSVTATAPVSVTAAAINHFAFTGPTNVSSGIAFTITVTAQDAFNNAVTGYAGTVHFTKSDSAGGTAVPGNYTFVPATDSGAHTFTGGVTLVSLGAQTVTVSDGISSGTDNLNVASSVPTHFSITAPASNLQGSALSITVTALDVNNNVPANYVGTVHFTTTDLGTGVVVPVNYTFVTGDHGAHTFTGGVAFVTIGNQSITATDTSTSITGSATVNVLSNAATTFSVTAPSTSTAGASFSITVTALNGIGTTATSYTGTVHLTKTDAGVGSSLPANYTFQPGDNGVHVFTGVTLVTAASQTVTATDTVNGTLTGGATLTVTPAAVNKLSLSAPASATAGAAFSVTVTAQDQYSNTVTSYAGTVQFSKSDAGAGSALPSNYTFVPGTDSGVHIFTGTTLVTAAAQTITATDTTASSVKGTASVTVTAGAISKFALSAPANAVAGVAFSVTVTAEDQFNNTISGYTGTVHFNKTDSGTGAAVPANYAFIAGTDQGVHAFTGVVLVTAASQTLTVADTVTTTASGSAGVSVTAGAVAKFAVAVPSTATAGVAFSATVTAEDVYGNTVTGYLGTVNLSKSDAGTGSALPASYKFVAGDGGIHALSGFILVTAGAQSVSATDSGNSAVSGTGSLTVTAAAAARLSLSTISAPTAGVSFNATLTAFDAFGNTATGYTGTVAFVTSDTGLGATVPANYAFTSTDQGVHTFAFTLVTGGAQTIGAKDVSQGTLTVSANVNVIFDSFTVQGSTLVIIPVGPNNQFSLNFTSANTFTATINGASKNFSLPAINKITFAGSSNATASVNDAFHATTAVLHPLSLQLTGGGYEVDVSNTSAITVAGSGAATLFDSTGNDTFVGQPTTSALMGTGYSNTVSGYANVSVSSSGGTDTAYLYGSTGTDRFYGHENAAQASTSMLAGSGFQYQTTGFRYVFGLSVGGTDTAYLYNNSGTANSFESNDHLSTGTSYSVLYGGTFYNQVNGFGSVFAASTSGKDSAYLHDTASDASGKDQFWGYQDHDILLGSGFYTRADGFLNVLGTATAGNHDVANMFDSAGGNRFYGHANFSLFVGDSFANQTNGDAFSTQVNNFGAVNATSTTGSDIAYLYDSPGNDRYYSYPTVSMMVGSGFQYQASGFKNVFATSTGGTDMAYLYSSGNATFDSFNTWSVMIGQGYYNLASNFRYVEATSTGSNDVANLYDTAGGGTFEGHQAYSVLYGGTFYNQAAGFSAVTANGAGVDSAFLFDADGLNKLYAANDKAIISYTNNAITNTIAMFDFKNVLADPAAQGVDLANVQGVDFNLKLENGWTIDPYIVLP